MRIFKNKVLNTISIVLLSIMLVWIILSLVPRVQSVSNNVFIKRDSAMPMLIAHGGGNQEYPDNTFESFTNAYNVRSNVMLETDVSLTKDGVLLMTHDVNPRRKTKEFYVAKENASQVTPFSELNYTDLILDGVQFNYHEGEPYRAVEDEVIDQYRFSSYNRGEVPPYSIRNKDGKVVNQPKFTYQSMGIEGVRQAYGATTLEDLIVNFPTNTINVEIKQKNTETDKLGDRALAEALRLIEKYDAYDRVIVATADGTKVASSILKANKENPKLMFSPADAGVTKFYILQMLGLDVFFAMPTTVMQVPQDRELGGIQFVIANKQFVKNAHRHNIAVHYWTINKVVDFEYLSDIGADGIMTDMPTKLYAYYNGYISPSDYKNETLSIKGN